MSDERSNTSTLHPHSQDDWDVHQKNQPGSYRGRGRGHHNDNTGRYQAVRGSWDREEHYQDMSDNDPPYHENRGRGHRPDNRGRGYHPQNRGRGHQFEGRGRGHPFASRGRGHQFGSRGAGHSPPDSYAGGHHQENRERPVDPQETLALLGVDDLRQHLERLKLEGRSSNNSQSSDAHDEEPRSQYSPRGRARGRGNSSNRGRGRSGDRSAQNEWRDEEIQQEIYINDVYNIKVEMSTSTGQKTYKLDQDDRLSNLKHVPDFEDDGEAYQPLAQRHPELPRGQVDNGRGLGRGRGQFRGRGRMFHMDEGFSDRGAGTGPQRGEGRFGRGRGRGRGTKHFDSGFRSRQFRNTNFSAQNNWKPEVSKEDAPKQVDEPVVQSEENWDLEITEYEALHKETNTAQGESVESHQDDDIPLEEAASNQNAPSVDPDENYKDYEGADEYYHDGYNEYGHENVDVDYANDCVGHVEKNAEAIENYDESEFHLNTKQEVDDVGASEEQEQNVDTYYAEECEDYVEEKYEAIENYDEPEIYSETYQEVDDVKASEIQNVDENTALADDHAHRQMKNASNIDEGHKANESEEANSNQCETNKVISDGLLLPPSHDNDETEDSPMKTEDNIGTSPKHLKKPKNKKKKVRITAP